MSNSYDDFLRRFVLYRLGLKMSQEEFGKLLGKTQSQLSKIELRKTIASFDILESLLKIGGDIDNLVTGKRGTVVESRLTDYLIANVGKDWKVLKEVLIWIMEQEFQKNGGFQDADSKCEYELLKILLYSKKSKTVMLAVRNVMGMNQNVMAERLGVDVKKFRSMERGKLYPDAELLVMIYEMSSCRPTVFFHHDDAEGYLLDSLWNKLDERRQEEAKGFLDHAIGILISEGDEKKKI